MSTYCTFALTNEMKDFFGHPSEESPSTYRREGEFIHVEDWFKLLRKLVGEVVSVPDVSLFVPVSRNAIHKRIKQGKLSCFQYQITEGGPGVSKSLVRGSPYSFVPVRECKIWYQEQFDRTQNKSGARSPKWIELDARKFNIKFKELHEAQFEEYGETEYERMKKEYFEKRERDYGW